MYPLQSTAPGGLPEAQMKIRTNVLNTLTRKFVDVVKAYQTAQQEYKREIKEKVRRQVTIVKPDATEGVYCCCMRIPSPLGSLPHIHGSGSIR